MVTLFGYLFAGFGFYLLYENEIVVGALFIYIGGFISGKLKFNISSAGVIMVVLGVGFGWHNGFTKNIILLIVLGVLLIGVGKSLAGRGYDVSFGEVGGRSKAKMKRL